MRVNGRVGSFFDTRIVSTNRSYNYKLRATWLTREVIHATARLKQLQEGLSNDETIALVTEAESLGETIIIIEIDPREGSGIIPRDWNALLRLKAWDEKTLLFRGVKQPELRKVKALSGTNKRDYSYDVFWVAFSLLAPNGQPVFAQLGSEAELLVRIYDKEGLVSWPVPAAIRRRALNTGR